MQLKTILNRVERQQSFVYGTARFIEGPEVVIEIAVRPRANRLPHPPPRTNLRP